MVAVSEVRGAREKREESRERREECREETDTQTHTHTSMDPKRTAAVSGDVRSAPAWIWCQTIAHMMLESNGYDVRE